MSTQREIKFRIWNTTNKCFYTEDHVKSNLFNFLERTQEPVMQFTGLKDKNGKEIYEGDLVKDCSHTDLVFPIQWNDEWAGYKLPQEFDEEYTYPLSEIECEIIGNIYENPELLK